MQGIPEKSKILAIFFVPNFLKALAPIAAMIIVVAVVVVVTVVVVVCLVNRITALLLCHVFHPKSETTTVQMERERSHDQLLRSGTACFERFPSLFRDNTLTQSFCQICHRLHQPEISVLYNLMSGFTIDS